MSAAHWVSAFLETQAAERGAADNTQLAYGRDLLDFTGWLAARQLDLASAQRADVEAYLIGCEAEGLALSTRARRLSSIKQLYRFAFEEGLRLDNPAVQITGPGRAKRLPKTLSVEEVDQMLVAAQSHGRTPEDHLRNACLMQLLYATGMRVSELVTLPLSSARGDPRMLLIRGKGGKERMVPLSPPARVALAGWLACRDGQEDRARLACLRPRSRRTRCAMPLPPICWPMAPICARSRPFSAMPMSPPPKSTPMCWRNGCAIWCWTITRWPATAKRA